MKTTGLKLRLPFNSWIAAMDDAKARVQEVVGGRYMNRNFSRSASLRAANNPWQSASNIQLPSRLPTPSYRCRKIRRPFRSSFRPQEIRHTLPRQKPGSTHPFYIANESIKALQMEEAYSYLGTPIGYQKDLIKDDSVLDRINHLATAVRFL
ncbi:unnamed protein product [Dimorphilus gyrociliatus]|uniref:Uncharacterized protein n=1 Tax=Dimorphilus gyrociliatus TaxID=2664684 RepID=A0A7I8VT75_9ANNE|nr:unnamed protein product [Dimorphilus gyrociliatus]